MEDEKKDLVQAKQTEISAKLWIRDKNGGLHHTCCFKECGDLFACQPPDADEDVICQCAQIVGSDEDGITRMYFYCSNVCMMLDEGDDLDELPEPEGDEE